MVIAEVQFLGGTQHALRLDAQDRSGLDDASVRHRGARRGEGDHVANSHIEGTAPHVSLGAIAHIDPHPVHLGGVGVTFGAYDPRGDDAIHGGAHTQDLLDLHAQLSESSSNFFRVVADWG